MLPTPAGDVDRGRKRPSVFRLRDNPQPASARDPDESLRLRCHLRDLQYHSFRSGVSVDVDNPFGPRK